MRKAIKIVVACLIVFGLVALIFLKNILPEQEAYISYDGNEQVQLIHRQIEDLDLEKIREKAPLIMEKSVDEIQGAIREGQLSYEELVAFYLDRIDRYDTGKKGIHAVAEINPNAMKEARAWDRRAEKGRGLNGMPILLKDNINTKAMPTSGGTYALKDFVPGENADVAEALTKSGAIILGKSNLSELANFMDARMPSGYSSKVGQTHNPFDPIVISPKGSSSGSGAAVAINLTSLAIGTETTGSVIAPAAIHSIVGMKPTKDIISTKGVLPLSSTMDTVGLMAKNVEDVALLYNGALSDKEQSIQLKLDKNYLEGKRIGVIEDESHALAKKLERCGAKTVAVTFDEEGIDNSYIIFQEFKKDLNRYLTEYSAPVKSLHGLIAFNQEDLSRRAKYGQRLIQKADKVEKADRVKVSEMVKESQQRIDRLLFTNKLDAIAFYDNDGVLLPAVAGYPELTVPFGMSEKNEPVGITFISGENEDEHLIDIAYSFEQTIKARAIPKKYLKNSADRN